MVCKQNLLADRGRTPGFLRLCGRDRHHAVGCARPQEAAPLQPLGKQACALTVVPDHFQKVAAASTEAKQMAAQRVALKNLLDLQGQRRKALPHVGIASRKPHPHAGRQRDHRGRPSTSAATAAVSVATSTAPVIRIRTPATNSISMPPPPAEPTGAGIASDSRATIAGTKPCCCSTPSLRSARNARRHRISNDRDTPYRRAVAEICRGVCKLSRTILSFSSSLKRRRRPVSTTSSRSTWLLRLSLSIRTVLNTEPHLTRRPSAKGYGPAQVRRSEEHTSELQSPDHLVCRLLLEKKKKKTDK